MFGLYLLSTASTASAAIPPFTPVPEGDFQSNGDLTGWVVTETGSSEVYEDTSTILLGSRILSSDRGSGGARAVACSPLFVLTRTDVSALMKDVYTTGAAADTAFWVETAARVVLVTDTLTTLESSSDYRREHLDVTSACGETVRVCVEPESSESVAYDDFRMEGAPCVEFVDDDADGVCPVGQDLDGDGACLDPGEVDAPLFDCDDGDDDISPLASEVCDGLVDEDCDGVVDNGFDLDADDWTTCQGDCDDGDDSINPGWLEDCNGIDDDCDKLVDEDFDFDNDQHTSCGGDCNDADANVFPGAPEQCNGEDDDCNGLDDDDVQVSPWWPDRDGDGFGDETAAEVEDCVAPPDTVGNDEDCDDTRDDVNPLAPDRSVDGIDQDCDGTDGNDGTPGGGDDTGTAPGTDTETDTDGIDRSPGENDGADVAIQAGCGCGGGASAGGLVLLAAAALVRRRR